jgi:hypothetical protein
VIFLPTVRHSGTWFIQKLFQQGGYKIVNLDRALFAGEHIPSDGKAILHTHIDVNLPVIKALHAKHPKPNHALAITFYEQFNENLIDTFAHTFPTLIPMRDPLLSVITRETRHPEQAPHTYLVDSWRSVPIAAEPFFIPVDLGPQPALLTNALAHCGVKPWPGFAEYAQAWTPQNKIAGAPTARAAYARKDAAFFEEHFPVEWTALRLAGDVKRLFQQQGYEDLLWW